MNLESTNNFTFIAKTIHIEHICWKNKSFYTDINFCDIAFLFVFHEKSQNYNYEKKTAGKSAIQPPKEEEEKVLADFF